MYYIHYVFQRGLWCPDWAPWGHRILTNDIAILELMRSAPAYAGISPIKLAKVSPPPGTTAWVGGWGMNGFHPTESLNLAPMSVQKDNFRECKQQQTPGKMCVIGKDFGGPCPGDSGSPLVTYNKRTGPRLIGLVSNGAQSCKDGLPGIFTRVSHYNDWIEVAMQTARRVGTERVSSHYQQPHQNHGKRYQHSHNYQDSFKRWQNNDEPVQNSFNGEHHTGAVYNHIPPKSHLSSNRHPTTFFGRFQRFPKRFY